MGIILFSTSFIRTEIKLRIDFRMSLLCSLSNEVPEHPVISPRSGHVFERRLIEKYLAENGTDPIDQQPLAPEELIELKTSPFVRPKPPSATSIPAILKTLQVNLVHSLSIL